MRTRIQAVRLYGKNQPVSEIIEITGLPRRTINRWYSKYLEEGISGFVEKRQGGNHQYLTDEQIQDLKMKLHQYRPVDVLGREQAATSDGLHWCINDLRQAIQQWYKGRVGTRRVTFRYFSVPPSQNRACDFHRTRLARINKSRVPLCAA